MTLPTSDDPVLCDLVAIIARRLIRAYHDVVARGPEVFPTLTIVELVAVRAMLHEMWDAMSLMNAGNLVLFIDEELTRRRRGAPPQGGPPTIPNRP